MSSWTGARRDPVTQNETETQRGREHQHCHWPFPAISPRKRSSISQDPGTSVSEYHICLPVRHFCKAEPWHRASPAVLGKRELASTSKKNTRYYNQDLHNGILPSRSPRSQHRKPLRLAYALLHLPRLAWGLRVLLGRPTTPCCPAGPHALPMTCSPSAPCPATLTQTWLQR